jgi:hypothetical protein
MAASTVTLTSGSSQVILAADEYRDKVVLQLQSLETAYLAFGEDAVNVTGLALINIGDTMTIRGAKARGAINGYSASTPTIGIETNGDIAFSPGPFVVV